MGITSPCLECKKRHAHCHSECEDYKTFRSKLEELRELKEKAAVMGDYVHMRTYQRKTQQLRHEKRGGYK